MSFWWTLKALLLRPETIQIHAGPGGPGDFSTGPTGSSRANLRRGPIGSPKAVGALETPVDGILGESRLASSRAFDVQFPHSATMCLMFRSIAFRLPGPNSLCDDVFVSRDAG